MKNLLFRIIGSAAVALALGFVLWVGNDTTPQPPAQQNNAPAKPAGKEENSMKDFKIN
jgi:hypothetical protein